MTSLLRKNLIVNVPEIKILSVLCAVIYLRYLDIVPLRDPFPPLPREKNQNIHNDMALTPRVVYKEGDRIRLLVKRDTVVRSCAQHTALAIWSRPYPEALFYSSSSSCRIYGYAFFPPFCWPLFCWPLFCWPLFA